MSELHSKRSPSGMHDMRGWGRVSCHAANMIRRDECDLRVVSVMTDQVGRFGKPAVFTEWWWDDEPVLRDYEYLAADGYEAYCVHWVASVLYADEYDLEENNV